MLIATENISKIVRSLLIVCSAFTMCRGQQTTDIVTIPVEDKTMLGSPIRLSGNVSLRESVSGNVVTSSRAEDVEATNISDKPILMIVAYLRYEGAMSSAEDLDIVVDNFFKEKDMLPGENIVLFKRPMGEHSISEPFRAAHGQKKPARAEFSLLFVQFADGSTFGAAEASKKWLDKRESTLLSLGELERARENGESAFVKKLDEVQKEGALHSVGSQIWAVQQQSGTNAAVSLVGRMLLSAAEHEKKITESKSIH